MRTDKCSDKSSRGRTVVVEKKDAMRCMTKAELDAGVSRELKAITKLIILVVLCTYSSKSIILKRLITLSERYFAHVDPQPL